MTYVELTVATALVGAIHGVDDIVNACGSLLTFNNAEPNSVTITLRSAGMTEGLTLAIFGNGADRNTNSDAAKYAMVVVHRTHNTEQPGAVPFAFTTSVISVEDIQ